MFSELLVMHRTVCEDDLDEMQHVKNLQYLRWSLQAAVAHSREGRYASSTSRSGRGIHTVALPAGLVELTQRPSREEDLTVRSGTQRAGG
jgi:acyl-CoA thioesterase FadM